MLDALRRRLGHVLIVRSRATYHQKSRSIVLPRFVRKFFYQYPRAPFYGALGAFVLVWLSPYYHFWYAAWTLDREDYLEYRRHYNAVVLNRARHGEEIYIPFFNEDKSRETFEYFRQRTAARRAGRQLAPLNPPDQKSEKELSAYPQPIGISELEKPKEAAESS
ncbi:putative rotein [Aphelenchoides fujianensis]|nr:putative rotein [Aphelenchoides fujianensis]